MNSVIILSVLFVLMGVSIWVAMRAVKRGVKPARAILMQACTFALLFFLGVGSTSFIASAANEPVEATAVAETADEEQSGQGFATGMKALGMGLVMGLGCIGSGLAVAAAAPAAIGAMSEDPKTFGKSIVFVGLAEGVSIFALIAIILIQNV
mgnify:CR=1 FL=1